MEIKIYQIKKEKFETCNYVFSDYDYAKEHGLSLEDYCCMYTLDVPKNEYVSDKSLLEKVFKLFNVNRPVDFKGHSLSVSDIVSLGNEYYYCDDFGWEKI